MKTFEEYLQATIKGSHPRKRILPQGECQSPAAARCTLCHAVDLDYASEVTAKNESLRLFLEKHVSPQIISPLTPSPLGRWYRTVTKRRVFQYHGATRLGLIAPAGEGSYKPFTVVKCAIEPASHAPIFQHVQGILDKPSSQPLAEVLSYVIIKGSYTEFTLILNVRRISSTVVNATNTLSKSLTRRFKEIVAVFLYEDTSDRRYYLGSPDRRTSGFRRIFGNKEVYQRICGRSFLYSPLSFSQVNMSMADQFVVTAGELLELDKSMTVFDLYSGYGLFALCFSEKVSSVIGVEIASESVASAIANAKRQRVTNARFIRSNITVESVSRLVAPLQPQDVVLLDPPRSGTLEGVIESIAAHKPARVLHIFCNIDIMPAELKRWDKARYTASRVIPFDMFPGTSSMETMVLLRRG